MFQRGELLVEREILEEGSPTRPQKADQRSERLENEFKHGQAL